ncbi:MAG: hypothetical protein KDK08_05615 [Rhizobiaceae bacterium]|nr:hypothetical protein [Rhizobiaceae bacterium]MCC0000946.1 hypothetical protein [Methylobacteriaceae bacterium]
MNMPDRVQIGPYPYEIREWDHAVSVEAGAYGLCDMENQTIWVRQTLKGPRKAEVLLHEILHACWESGSLPDAPDEEHAVNALGIQLTQAMRANPEVFRWIISNARKAR